MKTEDKPLSEKIQETIQVLEECRKQYPMASDLYLNKIDAFEQCLKWHKDAVEKLKETIKEGVTRNKVLPLDWCFDRIDKIFGEFK